MICRRKEVKIMEIDMKAKDMAIGNRLREARHNVNVEKAEMARLFNVSED